MFPTNDSKTPRYDEGSMQFLVYAMVFSFAVSYAQAIQFENVAKQAGIQFVVENSPTPQKHMVETMAGGVGEFSTTN